MTASPVAPEFDGPPPQAAAEERAVLGGMLLSADAIADVVDIPVHAEDFYRPDHAMIFAAITGLFERGEPADPLAVVDVLRRAGTLSRLPDGPTYLHTLISDVSMVSATGFHAAKVVAAATRRRLDEAGTGMVQAARAGGDVDAAVDAAQAAVFALSERRGGDACVRLGDLLPPALEEIEAIADHDGGLTGVPSGFADLDELTNGLHPGQLWIVAARPALGKSTLGLDVARAVSINAGLTAVVFSLEMSRSEIAMRLLSAEARVALQAMRTGRLTEADWARLARRMGEVMAAPLYVDDSPHSTATEIRAKCRRLKQRHDLRLVVVDYMQLMASPKRVESRQQEVTEISRQLKLLAKELHVPVIAISQLNRSPEMRADKRPQLSDLRESGSLEQDADGVILLYREDAHDPESERKGEADLIVAKHRNGPTATVTVAFQGHYSRFVDMAPGDGPAAPTPPPADDFNARVARSARNGLAAV